MCSSSPTVLSRDTRMQFTKMCRSSTRGLGSRYYSQSQGVRCSSSQQTSSQLFCSVSTSPCSPAESLPRLASPFLILDGAPSQPLFSRPLDPPSYSPQYGPNNVQSILVTAHRCCNRHLHPASFQSSPCQNFKLSLHSLTVLQ